MAIKYESNDTKPNDFVPEPVEGRVVIRKASIGKKLAKVFFPKDVSNVKDYLIWDIFLPNLKMFMLKNINDAFGGSSTYTGFSHKSTSGNGSWLNDNVSFGTSDELPSSFTKKSTKQLEDIDGLYYSSQEAAEKARKNLYFQAKKYNGMASVADLCRASTYIDPVTRKYVKIEPKWSYTNFGWTTSDIENADVRQSDGLWYINLPDARPIGQK